MKCAIDSPQTVTTSCASSSLISASASVRFVIQSLSATKLGALNELAARLRLIILRSGDRARLSYGRLSGEHRDS